MENKNKAGLNIVNFAVIVPMANEEKEFDEFISNLKITLDKLKSGHIYIIIDNVSTDSTLELSQKLSKEDIRFSTIWAPENKNIVDAYIRGYIEAYKNKHDFIIEMDAGMSHDPSALPIFIEAYTNGNKCVFGSRFVDGGSIKDSTFKRKFLSQFGTFLSNILLGTNYYDMTSGYQGFDKEVVESFIKYKLLSKAHFYQTELRYLLRKNKYIEVPIQYKAPSPSVSKSVIYNSIYVLAYYFFKRLSFNAPFL